MSANPTPMLDHLNFTVTNLTETVDWYGRVFGFEVVERGVYQGHPWAIVRSGDAMLCLYEHPDRHQPSLKELKGLHHFSHFGMRIRDREAWVATIERENLEVKFGGEVDWPNSSSWYVEDPSGYEIEVVFWDEDRISFGHAAESLETNVPTPFAGG